MGSIPKTVYYCCVSKGTKVLAAYSLGDPQIERWAALCLENAPPFHACYFQTVLNRIFAFVMEDEHIYFAIADEGLGKSGVKEFMEHVRDNYKKVLKNGAKGSLRLTSFCIREELAPVLRRLISSLETVQRVNHDRLKDPFLNECTRAHSDGLFYDGHMNGLDGKTNSQTSTEAPLLGKACKYEKLSKEFEEVREEREEARDKAVDRGHRIDVADANKNGNGSSAFSLQQNANSRVRTEQLARRMFWRHVRLVLLLDLLVCTILFGVWLVVCKGFTCLR
ncbi:phytolongin Phyl1.1-like [Nymphaea colorata]|uniref:Longin domain-containing protein n=1 Tax=Nymphaea colorata TaxID=210225 RepID=A0A5K0UXG2_9MAGN|nr:phytolongin Phyl1.1-like [Nymphaea colorata]